MKKFEYFYICEVMNVMNHKHSIGFWNQSGQWEEHPNSDRKTLLDKVEEDGWKLDSIVNAGEMDLRVEEKLNVPNQVNVSRVYYFKRELEIKKKGD